MKRGKCPTRKQKELLKKYRLNPENWLIRRDNNTCFQIIHRVSGQMRTFNRIGG